jgi:hypothetical protein
MEHGLQLDEPFSSLKSMTLRIDRLRKRIRLSGEFRSEHVHQVKAEMDQCGSPSVLDLEEVDLVDVEAIHFLNSCEARGVSVLNASAYIRAWMVQERGRPKEQTESL